jgi:hypothetical protein
MDTLVWIQTLAGRDVPDSLVKKKERCLIGMHIIILMGQLSFMILTLILTFP